MRDIESYRLGETNKVLQFENRAESIVVFRHMAEQCQRSLNIVSRKLDPVIFDTQEFVNAVKNIALLSKHTQIQIIIFDPEAIINRGYRLLELAGRLSSFIELRKAHHSFDSYADCLMIADATGYIHRKNEERYEGTVNFKDRRHSNNLLKQFSEMWELATPDPNLRKMTL